MASIPKVIASWITNGALAILDQGLFSAANFAGNVLMARWMTSSDYGAYSYISSYFYLLAGFHSVLLVEPMSIFGAAKYDLQLTSYLRKLRSLHTVWSLAVTSVLIAGWILLRLTRPDSAVAAPVLGLAVAQGLILYFWLIRRSCYLRGEVARSLLGSLVYAILLVGAIALLHHLGRLTSCSGLLGCGAAALAAGTLLLLGGGRLRLAEKCDLDGVVAVARENWRYGRWLTLSTLVYWLTGNAYFVLAGNLLSLKEAGALQALQNLVSPVNQVIAALGILFMPWCSRRFAAGTSAVLSKDILAFSAVLAFLAILYLVVLSLAKEVLITSVYQGNYLEHADLLPYLALLPVIMALSTGWQLGLRILQQNSAIFVVDTVGALFTIVCGPILVARMGLTGAVLGMLVSTGSRLFVLPPFWSRARRRQIGVEVT